MITSSLAAKMVLKRCSYKGCRSIHTPDNPSRETFFQFPKDETRYELWMAMSRCEDRSKSAKYLCSQHFDHGKYMSSNPRRNLLLANAVPFPYQSDTEDTDSEEEERLQDVVSTQYGDDDFFAIRESIDEGGEQTVSEESGIVIQFAESTDQQVEIVDQSSDFHKTMHALPEQQKASKPEVIEYYRKRKAPEKTISEEQTTVKIVKLRPVQSQGVKSSPRCEISLNNISSNSSRDVKADEKTETVEEELVMDPSVTTFIFKGEEYVQMPKKLYVDEKLKLLRELQHYKDIVVNFKNLLDNVKL